MQVPQTYRAYQYDNYGTFEKELHLRPSVSRPDLGPKQVRIKVMSAAINPIDYFMLEVAGEAITGKKPSIEDPFDIGVDGAGIVVEVGSDAKRLKVGDEVYTLVHPANARGTVADYAIVEEEFVALKPTNLTFDQAASLPGVALTSYQALVEHAKLQKGETVLILGGSSSTGMVGIQLARSIGASVAATTSAKNVDFLKGLGVHQVVDYHAQKWVDVLDPRSVDVIYDCGMEANAWKTDAQLVLKKETGRFVTLRPIVEPELPAKFGAKNLGSMHCYPTAKGLDEITKFVGKGELVPVIDTVYPFEKLPEALTKLKGRHTRGKLIIHVNDSP